MFKILVITWKNVLSIILILMYATVHIMCTAWSIVFSCRHNRTTNIHPSPNAEGNRAKVRIDDPGRRPEHMCRVKILDVSGLVDKLAVQPSLVTSELAVPIHGQQQLMCQWQVQMSLLNSLYNINTMDKHNADPLRNENNWEKTWEQFEKTWEQNDKKETVSKPGENWEKEVHSTNFGAT